jgi:hypothetical protein
MVGLMISREEYIKNYKKAQNNLLIFFETAINNTLQEASMSGQLECSVSIPLNLSQELLELEITYLKSLGYKVIQEEFPYRKLKISV